MIKHVVLMNWKTGVTPAQVEAVNTAFESLVQEIPEIARYDFGPDAGVFKGSADYALVAEFASADDLKTYVFHPRHQALLDEVTGPIMASFQSVQFEVGG